MLFRVSFLNGTACEKYSCSILFICFGWNRDQASRTQSLSGHYAMWGQYSHFIAPRYVFFFGPQAHLNLGFQTVRPNPCQAPSEDRWEGRTLHRLYHMTSEKGQTFHMRSWPYQWPPNTFQTNCKLMSSFERELESGRSGWHTSPGSGQLLSGTQAASSPQIWNISGIRLRDSCKVHGKLEGYT